MDQKCRHCGARLYEDAAVQPAEVLIPTNVNGPAIFSCYLGLLGFCIPLFGLVFAVPAVILGVIAPLRLRQPVSPRTELEN